MTDVKLVNKLLNQVRLIFGHLSRQQAQTLACYVHGCLELLMSASGCCRASAACSVYVRMYTVRNKLHAG